MSGLLVNEFVKLKHSKAVKGVFIAFMFLALFVVFAYSAEDKLYGFNASFMWLSCNGACGFFLYGLIVAGMVASEFEAGVVHNALGSGVGRNKYFAAKLISVFGVSAAVYVLSTCVLTILSSMKNGFDPEGQVYSNYGLKVLVFNAGALVAILAYVALFMFLAYLFRVASLTFVAAVAATIIDLAGGFPGPMSIAWKTVTMFLNDAVLSWDFAALFLPCVVILFLSLAGAYALFRVRDVT